MRLAVRRVWLGSKRLGCAAAGPFFPDELYDEVKSAAPYAGLTRAAFDAVLGYAATGGYALKAYERYQRLVTMPDGRMRLRSAALARQWRMNSGTIVEAVEKVAPREVTIEGLSK